MSNLKIAQKVQHDPVPGTVIAPVTVGDTTVIITGWQGADEAEGLSVHPIRTVVSLRGKLPYWVRGAADIVPGLAVQVWDGWAPPPLAFSTVCHWTSTLMESDSDRAPLFCCWLGRSRSVTFAAVWLATWLGKPLEWVLEQIAEQYEDAEPHIALLKGAFSFLGEDMPTWIKGRHSH